MGAFPSSVYLKNAQRLFTNSKREVFPVSPE